MHLEKIDDYRWLIPRTYKAGMLTDALVYASEPLLEAIRRDQSLEQAANVAMLPGIVGRALAMPDIHQGYGFPIGGVAAVDEQDGVVSPGGVGFDINCGVRLLSTNLTLKEVRPKLRDLVHQLFRDVPSGTGQSSRLNISDNDLNRVLEKGPSGPLNTTWDPRPISIIQKNAAALPGLILMPSARAPNNVGNLSLERSGRAIIFWRCSMWMRSSMKKPQPSTISPRRASWC